MANIASGAGAGELLTVGVTSKAAYSELRDSSGNVITGAHKAAVLATQGTMPMSGLDDDTIRMIRVGKFGTIRTDVDSILFWDGSEGAAINTQRWTSTAATMTASQTAANGILFNAGAITTINTGIILSSSRTFAKYPNSPLRFTARARYTNVNNQAWDIGLAMQATLVATTAQLDSGAVWRHTGTTIIPVLAIGGTDVVTGADILGSLANTNYYTFDVLIDDDRVVFVCQNSATGAIISEQVLRLPLANTKTMSVTHVNAWMRFRNGGGVPASAGQLFVGDVQVLGLDIDSGKSWQHQMADINFGGEIIPTTFLQTSQMAVGAWPSNASLAAGTASYATLGGLYSIAATGSAATDFPLFGYLVPTPYTFKCTGVHVSMINTGAANAATPATSFLWALDNGSVAALSSGTHIKYPLGVTSIPISAAIGAAGADLDVNFDVPIIFQPGRFVDVTLRIVGGAATASQVIQGLVTLKGYFE